MMMGLPVLAAFALAGAETQTCAVTNVEGGTVPVGWSGYDVGVNWCKKCYCAIDGKLKCQAKVCPTLKCCFGPEEAGKVCCGATGTWVAEDEGGFQCGTVKALPAHKALEPFTAVVCAKTCTANGAERAIGWLDQVSCNWCWCRDDGVAPGGVLSCSTTRCNKGCDFTTFPDVEANAAGRKLQDIGATVDMQIGGKMHSCTCGADGVATCAAAYCTLEVDGMMHTIGAGETKQFDVGGCITDRTCNAADLTVTVKKVSGCVDCKFSVGGEGVVSIVSSVTVATTVGDCSYKHTCEADGTVTEVLTGTCGAGCNLKVYSADRDGVTHLFVPRTFVGAFYVSGAHCIRVRCGVRITISSCYR